MTDKKLLIEKDRRMFIRDCFGSLVAIPYLSSLATGTKHSSAFANVSDQPKRFIVISHPNQSSAGAFRPLTMPGKLTPSHYASAVQTLNERNRVPYRTLSLQNVIAQDGQISRVLGPAFNPYAGMMSTYHGVDMPGRIDHGPAALLGNLAASQLGSSINPVFNPANPTAWIPNWRAMLTLDEYLARTPGFYSAPPAVPVLRLGQESLSTDRLALVGQDPRSGYGISGNNATLTLNGDPRLIYSRHFEPSATTSTGDMRIEAINKIRQSLNSLKNSSKMSSFDKQKLENYGDSLNELGNSINSGPIPNQGFSVPPLNFSNLGNLTSTELRNLGNLTLSDIVTLINSYYDHVVKIASFAIKTGLTQVVTIGVESSVVNSSYAWAHSGSPRNWHLEGAHGADDEYLLNAQKWIANRILLELIKELDTSETANSKYIDNTLIMLQSECSFGHSGINHCGVFAGLGSGMNHGKFYDYCDWAREGSTVSKKNLRTNQTFAFDLAPGVPYNRLLVGILRKMGLQSSDYLGKFGNGTTTFGIWENYPHSFEAPFSQHIRDHFLGNPLPGIFKA